MTPTEICAKFGHDWIIHDGLFWDKAECLTCNKSIRDNIIRLRDLPNRRRAVVQQDIITLKDKEKES